MSETVSNNVATLKSKAVDEPVAAFFHMQLLELNPGHSRIFIKLQPDFLNFNGVIFGGIIMSLADQAFAYASNSLSYPSFASQFNTHFISGPAVGDELIAECRVIKSGRRVGISEVTVTNQDGKLIARATGTTIPVNPDTDSEKEVQDSSCQGPGGVPQPQKSPKIGGF